MIPRRAFFSDPDRTQVLISPDGRHVSYLAPFQGVMNLWVAPLDDIAAARPITRNRSAGIVKYAWAFTCRQVIYLQDFQGNEKWNVFIADIDGESAPRNLTPDASVNARFERISSLHPGSILVSLNQRDPHYHDVYRVDLASGTQTLVIQHPGLIDGEDVAGFEFDDDYQLRFAVTFTQDGGHAFHHPAPDGSWRKWIDVPLDDAFSTRLVDFDKNRRKAYLIDSRGRETGAVTRVDVETDQVELLAQNDRCDPGRLLIHPTEKTPQAVSFNYLRPAWTVLDPEYQADFDFLTQFSDDVLDVISQSLDGSRWIVTFSRDAGPMRFFLYDRRTKTARFLFIDCESLANLPLCSMHPLVLRARDGLELVCYLTVPRDSALDAEGRPKAPLPMVLWVHGGPAGRDTWGYHRMHQWLASRGYAVLSVNFRASTGLGKTLINAGNRQWGAAMHDDLIDAVNWTIAQGIADPKKIAIMGGSYGGYAALVGLTFTPEVFACAVAICGPSSLCTFLDSAPPYWKPALKLWHARVGDHTTPEGRAFLDSRSPLTFVHRIQRPLLIGQGANDPRVKKSESDQIVAAMQSRGIPVTYVVFPDEGHGFQRPENSLSFNAVAEAFLARHLGGGMEPVVNDFAGSTIQIQAGVDDVPDGS